MAVYHEIFCEQALEEQRIPHAEHAELTPYMGCEHGCVYCYLAGMRPVQVGADAFADVFVKTNLLEKLERELAQSTRQVIVHLGSLTDCYQPAEKTYALMPDILRLLLHYRVSMTLCTQSISLLRDYDLIDALSRETYVEISTSVTTTDEPLRRKLEPRSASTAERLEMLHTFRQTNASIGLQIAPVIPYLTDSDDNLSSLLHAAHALDADYVQSTMLYLRGATKERFFAWTAREYPQLEEDLRRLYKTGGAERHYKNAYYERFHALRKQLGLADNNRKIQREKMQSETTQITLF